MATNKHFINLVNQGKYDYIGMGNPDSDILIIGQEHAVNPSNQSLRARYEVKENRKEWEEIMKSNKPLGVRGFSEQHVNLIDFLFSPRTGYKWKINGSSNSYAPLIYNTTWHEPDRKNHVVVTGTWLHYQQIIDGITGKTGNFDLLDKCFMSELSILCAKANSNTNHTKTKAAVAERLPIWKDLFFQDFKTVIIAAGAYENYLPVPFSQLFPNANVIVTPQLGREQYVNIGSIIAVYNSVKNKTNSYTDLRKSIVLEEGQKTMELPFSDGSGKRVVYPI